MGSIEIKELITDDEIMAAFPIIVQLRTHLDEKSFLQIVNEAKAKEDYKLFALYDGNEMVAVIGFQPMITLYYGKSIWVCDLVTDEKKRSKGYGKKLLEYVHDWAKQHQYESIALSSGLLRVDAHRFYEEKMNYKKVSYVFKSFL